MRGALKKAPLNVRRRNSELHARVNGNLTLDFGEVNLTSYAGLEFLQRYLRRMDLDGMIRRCFQGSRLGGDFGVRAMIRLLIGLLVVGGRRLEHVAYVANDPLLRRFCRLQVLPTARTVSRSTTKPLSATRRKSGCTSTDDGRRASTLTPERLRTISVN